MKKILFVLMVLFTTAAFAGGGHGHRNYGHGGHGGHGGHWKQHSNAWVWVVPAIVGGMIVFQATRPQPVIIERTLVEPNCSPWTEVQNPDGTITRTRTCRR
ncbi:hypothetical protein E4H12_13875 [Candidatus Thorarchaeota archaeon]|nr:MAG: hypothetical protein E4H12_13875 [Candidatus Thorarchaeota archaeon]